MKMETNIPNNPIIPYVEATERDVISGALLWWDRSRVEKAYVANEKIHWMEVYAGEKSFKMFNSWLPDETEKLFKEFLVGTKRTAPQRPSEALPLLNVCAATIADFVMFVCGRLRYFNGVPSPMKHPEYVSMVVFRENTEDIYTGLEHPYGTRGK